MTVSYNGIPSNLRVPLFYAEVDNSMAGSGAAGTLRRLIVGQVNDDAGSEEVGTLVLVSRQSEAVAIGGAGSMLAAMFAAHRAIDVVGEVWCLPVKVTEGAAAKATVTVTGTASATGLINLYVGGTRVRTTATATMSAAAVASAVAESVNAAIDLPVKATAAGGVVTLEAKFKGELANDLR
ncbi:MAG: phage tail protein, partial [Pseudomonas farsensis]